MIFLTLGTQLPFDRLVAALDAWCAQSGCGGQVVAQIPDPGPGGHRPRHFTTTRWMAPADYAATARAATVIVSHAGMGTIITALDLARPLIVMPRRADLGEHRNDHQIATARRFADRPGLHVAETAPALAALLDRRHALKPGDGLAPHADPRLIAAVRAAIGAG